MIQSYHNTNKETGAELAQSQDKAMTQEQSIESIFLTKMWMYSTDKLTPSEICLIYNVDYNPDTPITSIRRAMNTLTKKGKLIKTDEMRDGFYDKLEHCWRLAKAEDKQLELL